MNPRYYDHLSELLDALIDKQKEDADDYAEYLRKLIALTKKIGQSRAGEEGPAQLGVHRRARTRAPA